MNAEAELISIVQCIKKNCMTTDKTNKKMFKCAEIYVSDFKKIKVSTII